MNITTRKYTPSDSPFLVAILKENNQYSSDAVEGPDAMNSFSEHACALFFVAEHNAVPVGLIRATYDGSRAMIHLLSVKNGYKNAGIGNTLTTAVLDGLKAMGAPSVSVTVTGESAEYWEKQGFEALPVFLMLKYPL